MDIELDGKCVIHKTFGKGSALALMDIILKLILAMLVRNVNSNFPRVFMDI